MPSRIDRAPCLPEITPLQEHELAEASALCLRSKASWGYDPAFLKVCQDALTLGPQSLPECWVTHHEGALTGIVQVSVNGERADLELMFIDPDWQGNGIGRALFDHAVRHATDRGARCLMIESDPGAQPFYEAMGARKTGGVPSTLFPGRVLPELTLKL